MRYSSKLLTALLIVIPGLLIISGLTVSAATRSNSLAQGFQVDTSQGEIVSGALVSLKQHTKNTAQLANTTNNSTLLGVADTNALVTISQSTHEVQVVLNGTSSALVSDFNGPVAGVGMKATKSGEVVGVATSNASGGQQRSITDSQGKTHTILVARVSLQVNVGHYDVPNNSLLPAFLRSIANTIAGRDVDVIRVLLAMIILVLGFAAVITIVFSSIRSTINAIGRNPMAAAAVRLGLLEVLLIALLVAVMTLVISYLVLRI
jgi:nucleoside-triphosphatase THEP1